MKIMLVAMDAGPSNGLRLVASELIKNNHNVTTIFGMGQPFPEGTSEWIRTEVKSANRVLIGLSSSKERAAEEILAAETAKTMGTSFGFFACTYGEFRRAWFRDIIGYADFVFTVSEKEAEAAKKFSPGANVVPSGNPEWATYFKPALGREEVRSHLGVKSKEKLILSVGSKEALRNMFLWGNLVLSTNGLDQPIRLILARHPGECNPQELYGDILKYSKYPIQFLEGIRSNDAVTGSDLVVSSLSSVGIAGACQRIPVIDYITEFDEMFWTEMSGSSIWEPAELGASRKVNTVAMLAIEMDALLDHQASGTKAMRSAQEKTFSLEQFERAAQKIVAALGP